MLGRIAFAAVPLRETARRIARARDRVCAPADFLPFGALAFVRGRAGGPAGLRKYRRPPETSGGGTRGIGYAATRRAQTPCAPASCPSRKSFHSRLYLEATPISPAGYPLVILPCPYPLAPARVLLSTPASSRNGGEMAPAACSCGLIYRGFRVAGNYWEWTWTRGPVALHLRGTLPWTNVNGTKAMSCGGRCRVGTVREGKTRPSFHNYR